MQFEISSFGHVCIVHVARGLFWPPTLGGSLTRHNGVYFKSEVVFWGRSVSNMADIVLLWLTSSAHPHIQMYTCTHAPT